MHPQTELLTPSLPPAPFPGGDLPIHASGLLEPKGAISIVQDVLHFPSFTFGHGLCHHWALPFHLQTRIAIKCVSDLNSQLNKTPRALLLC